MGNVSREGGIAFTNGKKPIRLMSQLIRWANNSPDTVILDFFGGSGSTAHAVMDMNKDGGRRQSITVTNNEVGKRTANTLRAAGHLPGDAAWEAEGVFERFTRPRLENVVAELEENIAFFKLTYEDENLVALDRKFEAIAPLLWLRAGGTGEIAERGDASWTLPRRFGVRRPVRCRRRA